MLDIKSLMVHWLFIIIHVPVYFVILDFFYIGAESLLNRQLILAKGLKASFDIRYKSNYFPLSGKNAGKPQTPRWLRTVDGEEEIIIKVY
jgi:hypothetical protein